MKEITPEIKELIFNMKETMLTEERGKIKGVGLAASQVGVSKKIIIVLTKEGPKGFINPKILKFDRKKEIGKEGCLSFPGLWLEIKRPKWVEIKAINEKGREITFKAEDFSARVFQHETDHLNNVLFFERLGFFERLRVKRDLDKNLDSRQNSN